MPLQNYAPGQVGTLAVALANTAKLMASDPALAEAQAREILKIVPTNGHAMLLLGTALRAQGQLQAPIGVLKPLATNLPNSAATQFEYGLALGDSGDIAVAIDALTRVVTLDPKHASAWRALGDQEDAGGRRSGRAQGL